MFGGKLVELILLSICMGLATYLAGILPLKLAISPEKIKQISLFSMGILIGTSLQLIIPEGVEVLYDSLTEKRLPNMSKFIGFSLLSGFVLMYLIDNFTAIWESLKSRFNFKYTILEGDLKSEENLIGSIKSILQSSITLGLVFHSFVDGISLASSVIQGNDTMKLIFFLMIIIHKLPTAFSLSSILIKENFCIISIKVHIIAFSLAAPIGAILSYFTMVICKLDDEFAVGILFLFSAGAFLYVVVHVMIDVASNGNTIENSNDLHSSITGPELLLSLTGMLIPIVLSILGEF